KCDPFTELRILAARHKDRVLGHPIELHTVVDHIDVQLHIATHLDPTTERDFTVTLGEMQIADRKVRTFDKHRIKSSGTFGQVLNVLVPTVFPWGSGACCFSTDALAVGLGNTT